MLTQHTLCRYTSQFIGAYCNSVSKHNDQIKNTRASRCVIECVLIDAALNFSSFSGAKQPSLLRSYRLPNPRAHGSACFMKHLGSVGSLSTYVNLHYTQYLDI